MTRDIIPMPRNDHRDVEMLLPWYVSGRLDADDAAKVQAHLRRCAACQAAARAERDLAARVAELPIGVGARGADHGWARLSRQLDREESGITSAPASSGFDRLRVWWARAAARPWLGWVAVAQFCLILVLAGGLAVGGRTVGGMAIGRQPAGYHALGAAPPSPEGNVVVIFRPETTEREFREILRSENARLVDGPSSTDAYLLHVAPAARPQALSALRRRSQVLVAEPVDPATAG